MFVLQELFMRHKLSARVILVAAFVAAAAGAALRAEILEQVLVKVNGEIFTKTDLEARQISALRQKGSSSIRKRIPTANNSAVR
jgi:hypothetical protein